MRWLTSSSCALGNLFAIVGGRGLNTGNKGRSAIIKSYVFALLVPADTRPNQVARNLMGRPDRVSKTTYFSGQRQLSSTEPAHTLSVQSENRTITISIIIPTKNRCTELQDCLESLLAQSVLPDQLIIIDQNEEAEIQTRIEKQWAGIDPLIRAKVKLCYLRDPAISGVCQARNRGMEMAQSNIWAFLDDDILVEPDFLRELLIVYRHFPSIDGVSGIITNYHPPSLLFVGWRWMFCRGRFYDERQTIYWRNASLRSKGPVVVSKFGSGVMSFRAETVRGMSFDENFPGLAEGEDVDFCARLRPGTNLVIAPGARVLHKRNAQQGRSNKYWLRLSAQSNWYLYYRNWRTGVINRLHFLWLNVGYGVAALLACSRRLSLRPWRELILGARQGREQAIQRQTRNSG